MIIHLMPGYYVQTMKALWCQNFVSTLPPQRIDRLYRGSIGWSELIRTDNCGTSREAQADTSPALLLDLKHTPAIGR